MDLAGADCDKSIGTNTKLWWRKPGAPIQFPRGSVRGAEALLYKERKAFVDSKTTDDVKP
jgi:hypothetical protein